MLFIGTSFMPRVGISVQKWMAVQLDIQIWKNATSMMREYHTYNVASLIYTNSLQDMFQDVAAIHDSTLLIPKMKKFKRKTQGTLHESQLLYFAEVPSYNSVAFNYIVHPQTLLWNLKQCKNEIRTIQTSS